MWRRVTAPAASSGRCLCCGNRSVGCVVALRVPWFSLVVSRRGVRSPLTCAARRRPPPGSARGTDSPGPDLFCDDGTRQCPYGSAVCSAGLPPDFRGSSPSPLARTQVRDGALRDSLGNLAYRGSPYGIVKTATLHKPSLGRGWEVFVLFLFSFQICYHVEPDVEGRLGAHLTQAGSAAGVIYREREHMGGRRRNHAILAPRRP